MPKRLTLSLVIAAFFVLFVGFADDAHADSNVCFCHIPGGSPNTLCTSDSGAQNGHRDHGDQPFGCECGDGFCTSETGEDCGTCPQDCGVCPSCGDETADPGEECGETGTPGCAGVTGCGEDGSDCVCDGCRCAPICVVDDVCNGSEECNNCSADCGTCPVCGNGAIEAGEQCDDGNGDGTDCCDACQFTANSCGDGDVCNGDEACSSGSCASGAPLACDDANVCNGDETCDPQSGCQAGTPLVCDDQDACTGDTCDSTQGCQHAAIVCTDGDLCTSDTCDPASGCLFPTLSCDDGDACTDDGCDTGLGCQTSPTDCDDGQSCTDDNCDSGQGCVHAPNHASCDDGNVCTDDSCDPSTGCVNADNTASCNDNSDCIDVDADGTCDDEEGTLSSEPEGPAPTPPLASPPAPATPSPSTPPGRGAAGGINCSLIREESAP